MPRRINYYSSVNATVAVPGNKEDRKADNRFYASTRWRSLRLNHLRNNPLCVDCKRQGIIQIAKHVHHVIERKRDPSRELDPTNLESLCVACHGSKRKHACKSTRNP